MLILAERHAWDNGITDRTFGLRILFLLIGASPSTREKIWWVEVEYPLNSYVRKLLKVGPDFMDPVDGDVSINEDRY